MGLFLGKDLKNLLVGIVIGLLLGLWFGTNLAKGKPVLSNPFTRATIESKIKKTGNQVLEQSGKALEKSGKALREAISDKN